MHTHTHACLENKKERKMRAERRKRRWFFQISRNVTEERGCFPFRVTTKNDAACARCGPSHLRVFSRDKYRTTGEGPPTAESSRGDDDDDDDDARAWHPVDERWRRWPAARATESLRRRRHPCSSTRVEVATAEAEPVEIALVRGTLLATLSCEEEEQGVAAAWPRQ